jgi:hypothetical protein
MATNLEHMARRLEDDPFFLACPLKLYAKSEGLNEDSLAAQLRCSKETYVLVCLCRAPTGDDESFQDDIERIAAKFSVDVDVLAEAIRRGQAIFQMSRSTSAAATLMAAQDGNKKGTTEDKGGNNP